MKPIKGILSALLFIITFYCFSPAFKHYLVSWDDTVYVSENSYVLEKEYGKLSKEIVSLNYHPLTMFTLAMNVDDTMKEQIVSNEPIAIRSFVQTNVFIHALSAILVFFILLLLTQQNYWIAFFVALLFSIHPLRVESVVWLSERKDVLYVFFSLCGVYAWIYYIQQKKRIWFVLSFIVFTLACLSKAQAVIVPLLFLALDYYYNRTIFSYRVWIEKIPFFALSLLFGFISLNVQKGGDFYGILHTQGLSQSALATTTPYSFFQKIVIASYGFSEYIIETIIPYNLCCFYKYPPINEIGSGKFLIRLLLALAVIGLGIWAYIRQKKQLAFGVAWYVLSVILVLQIISVGIVIKADRYSYLASIGVLFVLVYYLFFLFKKYNFSAYVFAIAMSGIALYFIYASQQQCKTWYDTEALWNRAIEIDNRNSEAYINRANHFGKRGDVAKAFDDLKTARGLGYATAGMYEGLGNCFGFFSPQNPSYVDSSMAMFDKALQLNPRSFMALFNRGVTNMNHKKYDLAISDFAKAETLPNTQMDKVYYNLAFCKANSGKLDEALRDAQQSITWNPNYSFAYRLISDIYRVKKDETNARIYAEKAKQYEPK